jgi:arylsulfatase A-like enzyme
VQCFAKAFEFLDLNRDADGWPLQLETFDPHEPFHAPDRFRNAYPSGWNGPVRDWPRYGRVDELPEECEELRANYYRVVALCDYLLGQLLDYFDEHQLWRDTALVLTTDHGFLLGEHDFWAKNRMNLYEEIVHVPLFVCHPAQSGGSARRKALTQTIDLAPTLLDLFGVAAPPEMQANSLLPLLSADEELRRGALFGYFGGAVNVTDGRHTYHRYPADLGAQEINQYTLMPTHLWERFTPEELRNAELAAPFSFTKGVPLLKVPVIRTSPMYNGYGPGALLESETRLFDLEMDPGQAHPLVDEALERRMAALMRDLMVENDAPREAIARVGL